MSSDMIVIESVTKRFGGTTAVADVSLTVRRGEALALLGPNGAGKTTLVRLLLDFVRPTAGRIAIAGRPPADPESRRRVGYVAERHPLPPHLTGRDYLARHAALLGLDGRAARSEIDRVLQTVSMTDGAERRRASSCSQGMRQRIALAAALLGRPNLLILDEPTAGLDPLGMRDFRHILETLHDAGVTTVVSSHLLSEVEKACASAAIIHRGRLRCRDRLQAMVGGGETLEDVFMRNVAADGASVV